MMRVMSLIALGLMVLGGCQSSPQTKDMNPTEEKVSILEHTVTTRLEEMRKTYLANRYCCDIIRRQGRESRLVGVYGAEARASDVVEKQYFNMLAELYDLLQEQRAKISQQHEGLESIMTSDP